MELLDENAKANIYMNLGTDINVSDVIVEMDELYDWEHCAEVSTRSKWDNDNDRYIDGVDSVSYTHLTLATICSV